MKLVVNPIIAAGKNVIIPLDALGDIFYLQGSTATILSDRG
jgi:hypothetical protein